MFIQTDFHYINTYARAYTQTHTHKHIKVGQPENRKITHMLWIFNFKSNRPDHV